MNWLVTLVISLVTVTYIAAPFLLRRRVLSAALEGRNHDLQDRHDLLQRSLQDLEFDRRTGKIDPDEFRTLRAGLAEESWESPRRESPTSGNKSLDAKDTTLEDEAERLILQAHRRPPPEAEAAAEALIEQARRRASTGMVESNAGVWTCGCGRAMSTRDRFCASCGLPRVS